MPPAPETTELEVKEELIDGLPAGSPKSIMSGFMKGVKALDLESDTKKEEPSGKVITEQRPVKVAPTAKPAVDNTAPPEKASDAPRDAGGDNGGADTEKDKSLTEAKPDATKAIEDKDDDYLNAPQPKDKKGWEKWTGNRAKKETALRNDIKTRDTQINELKTKLTELETKSTVSTEPSPELKTQLDRLAGENKELTEAVMRLRVTEHPKFKAHYQAPIDDAISEAKAIVGDEHAPTVERILKMDDNEYRKAQLDDFLSTLDDEGTKADVRGIVRDIRKANTEKAKEIKRVQEHNMTLDAQESTAATEKAAKAKTLQETAFKETLRELTDPEKGFAVFQPREGDDAWNQGVQKRLEAAKGLLTSNSLDPKVVVKAAHFAVALPAVLSAYHAESEAWKAEKTALESKLAELVAAQPKGGGTRSSEDSGKLKIDKDKKPWQQSSAWAKAVVDQFGV